MNKKILNLPLSYEQSDFSDERFTKVRVKVMHNGLNLNNSRFSDAVIEAAAPSLKNIPLLAFTKKVDGTDEVDFAGHEFEFKITEDGVKYVYLGRPIGMVPETNAYSYEEDEEGIKFVSVDAYIWNDYANEALDIVRRDNGKSVSMEVGVQDYEFEDGGALDILEYKYNGIVLLGEDVPPAMKNARLDIAEFSMNTISEFVSKFSQDLQETINEANKAEANNPTNSDPETKMSGGREAGADSSSSESGSATSGAGESDEGKESPPIAEAPSSEEGTGKEKGEVQSEPKGSDEEKPQAEVDKPIEDKPVEDEPVEPFNPPTTVITKDGITIRKFDEEFEAIKAENEALKEEIATLKEFKLEVEKREFDLKVKALVETFSDLPEEEVEKIVEAETDYETIELKLYALRGRLNSETPANRIQSYAIYDSILQQDRPSWETLVEKHINQKDKGGI